MTDKHVLQNRRKVAFVVVYMFLIHNVDAIILSLFTELCCAFLHIPVRGFYTHHLVPGHVWPHRTVSQWLRWHYQCE